MKNFQIGDQVRVDINQQGKHVYEPVYSFIHASSQGIYDYFENFCRK
jgi:hypothetical protein